MLDGKSSEELNLSDLKITSLDPYLPVLARMTTLRRLSLSRNTLTSLPFNLSVLKRVEVLNLTGNRFTSAASVLPGLASMPQLQHLFIELSHVEEEGMLKAGLPFLRSFNGSPLPSNKVEANPFPPPSPPSLEIVYPSDEGVDAEEQKEEGVREPYEKDDGGLGRVPTPHPTTSSCGTTASWREGIDKAVRKSLQLAMSSVEAFHNVLLSSFPLSPTSATSFSAYKDRLLHEVDQCLSASPSNLPPPPSSSSVSTTTPLAHATRVVLHAHREVLEYCWRELLATVEHSHHERATVDVLPDRPLSLLLSSHASKGDGHPTTTTPRAAENKNPFSYLLPSLFIKMREMHEAYARWLTHEVPPGSSEGEETNETKETEEEQQWRPQTTLGGGKMAATPPWRDTGEDSAGMAALGSEEATSRHGTTTRRRSPAHTEKGYPSLQRPGTVASLERGGFPRRDGVFASSPSPPPSSGRTVKGLREEVEKKGRPTAGITTSTAAANEAEKSKNEEAAIAFLEGHSEKGSTPSTGGMTSSSFTAPRRRRNTGGREVEPRTGWVRGEATTREGTAWNLLSDAFGFSTGEGRERRRRSESNGVRPVNPHRHGIPPTHSTSASFSFSSSSCSGGVSTPREDNVPVTRGALSHDFPFSPNVSEHRGSTPQKVLTHRQLTQMIERIDLSKEAYDQRCASRGLPLETMAQYLRTYLHQRYGLPHLVQSYTIAMAKGVKRYALKDHKVAAFAKIVCHVMDEGFRDVQRKVRATIPALLRFYLTQSQGKCHSKDIDAAVQQKMASYLEEQEWTFILEYMYSAEDAAFLKERMKWEWRRVQGAHEHRRKGSLFEQASPGTEEVSTDPGKGDAVSAASSHSDTPLVAYQDFLRVVLETQLEGRERFLAPYVDRFRKYDPQRTGTISRSDFCTMLEERWARPSQKGRIQKILRGLPTSCMRYTFSQTVSVLLEEGMRSSGMFTF